MKILIGSPIKQKSSILKVFLENLVKMDLSDLEVSYFFIDDNTEEASKKILMNFQKENQNVILKSYQDFGYSQSDKYQTDETHNWKKSLIERITTFKDEIIKFAQTNNFDYLFFIDSDIIMNSKTIKHLISQNVDIVSEVFWTNWNVGDNLTPQVWLQDESNFYIRDWDKKYTKNEIKQYTKDFIAKLKIPGLYEVGGLGACTLFSKNALKYNLSFKSIPNISFWGEDRHFCIRAAVFGLKLYVDTYYPAYHIYRESYLSGVDDYIKNGFNPNTFVYNPLERGKKNLKNILKNKFLTKISELKTFWKQYKNSKFLTRRLINDDNKITVSMMAYDNKHLEKSLKQAVKYAQEFIIFTNNDKDITLINKILANKKIHIIKIARAHFTRKMQWEETIKTNPNWILFVDSDEIIESKIVKNIKYMIKNNEVDVYTFKVKNEAHYYKYPYLIRYQPNFKYHHEFIDRLPKNILRLNYINSDIVIENFKNKKNELEYEDLI